MKSKSSIVSCVWIRECVKKKKKKEACLPFSQTQSAKLLTRITAVIVTAMFEWEFHHSSHVFWCTSLRGRRQSSTTNGELFVDQEHSSFNSASWNNGEKSGTIITETIIVRLSPVARVCELPLMLSGTFVEIFNRFEWSDSDKCDASSHQYLKVHREHSKKSITRLRNIRQKTCFNALYTNKIYLYEYSLHTAGHFMIRVVVSSLPSERSKHTKS